MQIKKLVIALAALLLSHASAMADETPRIAIIDSKHP